MHVDVPGILLLIAGCLGLIPVDGRAAWACVLVAGLVMVLL